MNQPNKYSRHTTGIALIISLGVASLQGCDPNNEITNRQETTASSGLNVCPSNSPRMVAESRTNELIANVAHNILDAADVPSLKVSNTDNRTLTNSLNVLRNKALKDANTPVIFASYYPQSGSVTIAEYNFINPHTVSEQDKRQKYNLIGDPESYSIDSNLVEIIYQVGQKLNDVDTKLAKNVPIDIADIRTLVDEHNSHPYLTVHDVRGYARDLSLPAYSSCDNINIHTKSIQEMQDVDNLIQADIHR